MAGWDGWDGWLGWLGWVAGMARMGGWLVGMGMDEMAGKERHDCRKKKQKKTEKK